MALTRRRNSVVSKSSAGFGLRSVRYTPSFGRNKILISNFGDIVKKNICDSEPNQKFFPIERLPEDILVSLVLNHNYESTFNSFQLIF